MAKIDFTKLMDSSSNKEENKSRTTYDNKVGFFNLKNDGDEAIVRFAYDSSDEFDILTTHTVKVGDRYRSVNCLKESPSSPVDTCPLCQSGSDVRSRLFIKLIQYVTVVDKGSGEQKIVPEAKVWERSAFDKNIGARVLSNYLNNYGSLKDVVCKIIRHGKPKDMQTTYEVIPNLSPMLFKEEIYVKDFSAFENYSVLGTIVMNKSFEDVAKFVATGEFGSSAPAVSTQTTSAPYVAPNPNPHNNFNSTSGTPTQSYPPTTSAPTPSSAPSNLPWGDDSGFTRPRRY